MEDQRALGFWVMGDWGFGLNPQAPIIHRHARKHGAELWYRQQDFIQNIYSSKMDDLKTKYIKSYGTGEIQILRANITILLD